MGARYLKSEPCSPLFPIQSGSVAMGVGRGCPAAVMTVKGLIAYDSFSLMMIKKHLCQWTQLGLACCLYILPSPCPALLPSTLPSSPQSSSLPSNLPSSDVWVYKVFDVTDRFILTPLRNSLPPFLKLRYNRHATLL